MLRYLFSLVESVPANTSLRLRFAAPIRRIAERLKEPVAYDWIIGERRLHDDRAALDRREVERVEVHQVGQMPVAGRNGPRWSVRYANTSPLCHVDTGICAH